MQCNDSRDALAKALYYWCFVWLFAELNKLLVSPQKCSSFFGILDIYGFEIFEHNSFEQLCINFTNERLAKGFVDVVFKREQAEYLSEGVPWEAIVYASAWFLNFVLLPKFRWSHQIAGTRTTALALK